MQLTSVCVSVCVSNSAKSSQPLIFTNVEHHCEYDKVGLKYQQMTTLECYSKA